MQEDQNLPTYAETKFPNWLKVLIIVVAIIVAGAIAWVISNSISTPETPPVSIEDQKRQKILKDLRAPSSIILSQEARQRIKEDLSKDPKTVLSDEDRQKILADLNK